MNEFVAKARIGPLEVGPRAGEYLEAGDAASAQDFASAWNVEMLITAGALAAADGSAVIPADETTDAEHAPEGDASNAPDNVTPRKRATKKHVTEAEHGTDDSNGD